MALRKQWLRGWESHPPEEVYEASLCALVEFPAVLKNEDERWIIEDGPAGISIFNLPFSILAVKLVESAGNAPALACLQGKCIACLPRLRFEIPNLRFEISKWQAALVLPQAN